MADKIVTDDILQKAIQDTIQIITDNIFEFESYDDESIANLFNLTPEEAQHISDLIADTVISQYKLWSSKKVSDELLSAKNECNDYTDTRLANISSISLKYCTALPSVGESNCIYILKSTDSNPDTLNLYDGTWVTIGNFTIKLDDYYKKSDTEEKTDVVKKLTEILAQDNVLTDTSLATTSNVLSATTTIEELDKKVDKTSIVTSVSSTSTDETVPSAKAVYDNCIKNNNIKTYTDITQLGLTTPTTVGAIYNAIPTNSCLNIYASVNSVTDLPLQQGLLSITKTNTAGFDIILKRSGAGAVTDNIMYIGQLKGADGTRLTWKRVCTTSVADNEVVLKKSNSPFSGDIYYQTYNGVCYVSICALKNSTMSTADQTIITGLPKPKVGSVYYTVNSNTTAQSVPYQTVLIRLDRDGSLVNYKGTNNVVYYGSFSYPVAES